VKRLLLSALVASAALAACQGGASSPPPFNTGAPTPSLAPRSVAFAWSGQAHSASSVGRSVRAVASAEPIVVAAAGGLPQNDPTIAFGQSQAVLTAKEVDANGATVDPNPKTVAVSDANQTTSPMPVANRVSPPIRMYFPP